MASTNPFQPADDNQHDGNDDTVDGRQPKQRRGAAKLARVHRSASRRVQRQKREKASSSFDGSGFPTLEGLKPVLTFLSVPAVLVLAITVTGGGWPSSILYPIAILLGLVVAISAFKGVELVLACMIIYLPFSKSMVVPLAPGVNGTNMLILLGLFAALLRAGEMRKRGQASWPPGTTLVLAFGFMSCLSAITITLLPGGRTYLIYNEMLSYKAWVDQFIFYFVAVMCIRDVEAAKRCFIYLLIGSVLVVLYSVPEMLEKMGRSTIEKSRIGGPHLQSNNFGGFVAYTVLPLLAVFIIYIKDLRAWLLTPYFLLTAKVLITTFSRGAYLAMAVGGLMAGWYKGRMFLFSWAVLALCFVLVFPVLIPDSITARMGSLTSDEISGEPVEESLDKSSQTRLIMWRAAAIMMSEDPVWGKGFKGFPFLKEGYTEQMVEESDPHNMYLYIGSQMGLPALSLFLLILAYSFNMGRLHSSNETDRFIKAIGIGGAASTACYAVVCIFGSRAVSLNFTANFWTLFVIMQVLKQHKSDVVEVVSKAGRKRTNAFAQRNSQSSSEISDIESEPDVNQEADGSDSDDSNSSRVFDESRDNFAQSDSQPARTAAKSRRQKKPLRGAAAHQAASLVQKQASDTAGEEIPRVSSKRRRKR